jgi:multidrug efflux pump subunit AcrA (membrane-fusion protein)
LATTFRHPGRIRSTLIVLISIPLSILTSIVVLYLLGERLNTMNREFPGKVTWISDALQSGTRTLLTEIDIPNPDGTLPPGAYCTVELKIPTDLPR